MVDAAKMGLEMDARLCIGIARGLRGQSLDKEPSPRVENKDSQASKKPRLIALDYIGVDIIEPPLECRGHLSDFIMANMEQNLGRADSEIVLRLSNDVLLSLSTTLAPLLAKVAAAKKAHEDGANSEYASLSSFARALYTMISERLGSLGMLEKDTKRIRSLEAALQKAGDKVRVMMPKVADALSLGDKYEDFYLTILLRDEAIASMHAGFLKLALLSNCLALPRSLNLEGLFSQLQNLAWAGNTPYELSYLRDNEIDLKLEGKYPAIDFIDKLPRYLMQVAPRHDNMRFLDTAKTRFGAYISEGYTQMPGASYINFNSGTLGACMNEGRISSSVIIGKDTDVGGGASILGVLSGGNETPISIGSDCLLGANSVTGIPLGDNCIVDAGISVLAGMKFALSAKDAELIAAKNKNNANKNELKEGLYKASYFSGLDFLHFRQNSATGTMILKYNQKHITLNEDLH